MFAKLKYLWSCFDMQSWQLLILCLTGNSYLRKIVVLDSIEEAESEIRSKHCCRYKLLKITDLFLLLRTCFQKVACIKIIEKDQVYSVV